MRAIVKIEDERERNANKKLSFEAGNSRLDAWFCIQATKAAFKCIKA